MICADVAAVELTWRVRVFGSTDAGVDELIARLLDAPFCPCRRVEECKLDRQVGRLVEATRALRDSRAAAAAEDLEMWIMAEKKREGTLVVLSTTLSSLTYVRPVSSDISSCAGSMGRKGSLLGICRRRLLEKMWASAGRMPTTDNC